MTNDEEKLLHRVFGKENAKEVTELVKVWKDKEWWQIFSNRSHFSDDEQWQLIELARNFHCKRSNIHVLDDS